MIRCGRMLAAASAFAPSGCSSMAAAMRPVSRVLRRTEVNAGHSREASGLSSKPTIDNSRGMLIPARMATL